MLPESSSEHTACSVGSYLRKCRESRGITVEDASRVTRIGKNYLSALEEDRFESLPNPAYVKGFLRAYGIFLGLSGDEVVAMYERSLSPAIPETSEYKGMLNSGIDERAGSPRQGLWIVPLLLLILVLIAAYIVRVKGTGPAKTPAAPSAVPAPVGPPPVQQPRSSAALSAGPTVDRLDKATSDLAPAGAESQPEGIVLKLKINQDSSLNVTIDDMISQQYDLKAGDLIEWKADKVITLEMGNAGGIEAELNGKPLKPFGEPDKAAHIVLKADTLPR
jgi:cytoskeleton protein RodZ